MGANQRIFDEFQRFFNAPKQTIISERVDEAKKNAVAFDTAHYRTDIHPELVNIGHQADALYQIFKDSQTDKQKLLDSGLIEMLAFTAQVLAIHYQSYEHDPSLKKYNSWLRELEEYVSLEEKLALSSEPSKYSNRFQWITEQVKENYRYIVDLIFHPSMFRDQLGLSNLTRIYWVFCHFSLNQIMTMVKDTDILKRIGDMLGQAIDLDKFSDALNMPNDILNILSVAFFAGRFLIDVIMIAKHTIGANEDESSKTTRMDRFLSELDKRFWSLTNCTVWGTVNLLTNYYDKFGIPVEWAFPIVAGVLVFDVALVFALHNREKSQYMKTMEDLEAQLSTLNDKDPQRQILNKMIESTREQWLTKQGLYKYNSVGAMILLTSFSLSLVLTPPGAVLACYLMCCMGIAIYSSEQEYANYQSISRKLAYAQSSDEYSVLEIQALKDEQSKALNQLVAILLERAFVPIAIFMVAGINPVAGLAVGIAYMAIRINRGFCQTQADPEPKEPIVKNQFSLFKPDSCESEKQVSEDYDRQFPALSTNGLVT